MFIAAKRWGLAMVALGLLLGVTGQGQAALITFIGADPGANSTDPRPNSDAAAAAFDAAAGALGPVTLVNFESSPLGTFNNLVIAPGVTMDGTDVGGSDQTIVNAPVGTPDNLFGYNTTAGGSQFVSLNGGTLTFSFTNPIESFGAYLSGLQGLIVGQQTITYDDGSTHDINIPQLAGGIAFVGFTDEGKQIVSVEIDVLGDIVGVDDVRFGESLEAVPEPSTFVMGATAVFGLFGMRKVRSARPRRTSMAL